MHTLTGLLFNPRITNWVPNLLGGTRHFGYWEKDTYWPFPIGQALRRIETRLFDSLKLQEGQVLNAGCGVGHVAIHMLGKGLKVSPRQKGKEDVAQTGFATTPLPTRSQKSLIVECELRYLAEAKFPC